MIRLLCEAYSVGWGWLSNLCQAQLPDWSYQHRSCDSFVRTVVVNLPPGETHAQGDLDINRLGARAHRREPALPNSWAA
jgi:hypothetical protein